MGRSADIPRAPGLVHGAVDAAARGSADGADVGCPILHVDMDAFFASVEVRNNPDLRGRPVVVGGGTRGVVAAASYEARRYGVRSAMPMTRALRLCPGAVVIPPDRAAYAQASAAVMTVLRDITPLVQPISIDEAFLDVSGVARSQGRPAQIAASIRERVARELALTCSVGVAATKFVAKVASARCKPDGLLVVPADAVIGFLHPLPVTVLWGVGSRTAEPLRRLGIRTIGELAGTPRDALRRAVGPTAAEHLWSLANGIDPRPVRTDDVEKSISAEHTLEVDLTERAEVRRQLLRLGEQVAQRLRERAFAARTVGVKIRFADFTTVTRLRTLDTWTDATRTIFDVAAELYDGLGLDRPRIRLVGIKCENLRPASGVAEQLSFEDLHPPGTGSAGTGSAGTGSVDAAVDAAIDAAVRRFGAHAVGFATTLHPPGAPAEPDRPPVPDDGSDGVADGWA